uniref:Uncharacterized protein n=1 Tax=Lepeophtheirus salmonis TaxID=72036 RepID=A0A0K2USC4_LEPSM
MVASISDVESFHRSVLDLRRDPGSECNKSAVEKGLSALNPNSLSQSKSLVSDLEWILETFSTSTSLIKTILNFLEKICEHNEEFRIFLRDSSNLMDLSMKFLSKYHSLKALRLIQYLVLGWKVGGPHMPKLEKLVQYVMKYITDGDREMTAPSVFILVCLYQLDFTIDNILIQEDVEYLFIQKQRDPKLQVLIKMLHYSISRSIFIDKALSENEGNYKQDNYVLIMIDAFCTAYADEDILTMRLFTEILKSITRETKNKSNIEGLYTLNLVRRINHIADFGEGSTLISNECMFEFLRRFLMMSWDYNKEAFNLIIKLISQRLESCLKSPLIETILCLQDVLGKDAEAVAISSESQTNGIVSKLLKLISSNKIDRMERLAVLRVLRTISKPDFNWSEYIVSKLPSPINFINSQIELIFDKDRSIPCVSVMLVDLILFCKELNDVNWKKIVEDVLLKNEHVIQSLRNCLNDFCHPSITKDIFLSTSNELLNTVHEEKNDDYTSKPRNLDLYGPVTGIFEDKIDSTVDFIRKSIENNKFGNISSSSVELFELGNFLKDTADHKLEILQHSLEVAEKTIDLENIRIVQVESQVKEFTHALSRMDELYNNKKVEINEIDSELESLESNSFSLKNEMRVALDKKIKEHEELEKNYEKLSSKALKYKDDVEALQETIQEHFKVQAELQENLKSEKKLNSDMVATLEKQEEKLKKKDRALNVESNTRQLIEKEIETLKKDYKSQLGISKRQLDKKDKQIAEKREEINSMKEIQNQILKLSKLHSAKS